MNFPLIFGCVCVALRLAFNDMEGGERYRTKGGRERNGDNRKKTEESTVGSAGEGNRRVKSGGGRQGVSEVKRE